MMTRPERASQTLAMIAAERCHQALEEAARGDGPFVTWVMLEVRGKGYVEVTHGASDLYNGIAGIALFLAYFARVTGQRSALALAHRAAATLSAMAASPQLCPGMPGAYAGLAGIAYCLSHLALLLDRNDLSEQALGCGRAALSGALQRESCELATGSAGVLAVLCALAESGRTCMDLRTGVTALLQHIERGAQPSGRGTHWRTPVCDGGLPGFAHGTAGVLWALGRAAELTGSAPPQVMMAGLEHIRSLYREAQQHYHVSRSADGQALNFCDGSPGILTCFTLLSRVLGSEAVREDFDRALQGTVRLPRGADHCLCHGDMGVVASLSHAARHGFTPAAALAHERADAVARQGLQEGWKGGLPVRHCPPGLMLGIAGIGLQLLAIARPGCVPNALSFDPVPELWRHGA